MESTPNDFCNIEPTDQSRDYRQELFDRYKDFQEEDYSGIDDFIEDSDKVSLIRFVNEMVERDYGKYPEIMTNILVKRVYYQTIQNMDKTAYLEEKERDKELSTLDKELLKIKEEKKLILIENQDEIKEE